MSLDKAIKHKKEKRQPYRGSKRFDVTCHNHNRCAYCRKNRTFNAKRKEQDIEDNSLD